MNIQILHSHLLEFLDTKAKPAKIAEALALCGPSVEKLHKVGKDYLYDIEITTNRIDTASVLGIAREASSILPQFGLKANLQTVNYKLPTIRPKNTFKLIIKTNPKLTKRVMAVVIDDVKIGSSPKWLKERLEAAGIRSLNNLVDITNYVMLEIGHPTHVFDFDKLGRHKLIFRLSKKGEKITTLDNKTYDLPGNDIVIEDGIGEIIDLPGIMGTKNSVVGPDTKRIVFFLDNNDSIQMRKTSMTLGIRTQAVQLNEKNVDPELAKLAIARGIDLYQKLASGKVASQVYDIYLTPPKKKTINITLEFITSRLGVTITPTRVKAILTSLGFEVKISKDKFQIGVPSFRSEDVEIPEDIVEEVARIYGYHNLPSILMTGAIPQRLADSPFEFEEKVKKLLAGWGGVEVYNYSLVPKEYVSKEALRLKNPLGSDTEYLRTSLKPGIFAAAKQNSGIRDPFHLFEMSNIYIPRKSTLPQERLVLAGIFVNYDYRRAKGVIEALMQKLHISDKNLLNDFVSIDSHYYYEFEVEKLRSMHRDFESYVPIPKYPAQIEDITFSFEGETKIGEVLHSIEQIERMALVELSDVYKNAYTFRIHYQHPTKTLTDKDVEKIREKIIMTVKKKFGGLVKS